jgi:hypothetical protein
MNVHLGKKYGNWKVVRIIKKGDLDFPSYMGGYCYECECSCGVKSFFKPSELNRGVGTQGNREYCRECAKKSIGKKLWKGYGEISAHLWAVTKQNARKRKLEFLISIEDAWEKFLAQKRLCALSGVCLVFSQIGELGTKTTASLDRIDSKKGYLLDNIQWIHKDIQRMKSNFDEDYFVGICKSISLFKS